MSYEAGAILIVAAIVLAGAAVLGIRRLVAAETLKKSGELAGVAFLQVGVIYGVLLAFAVSMVWQEFSDAANAVDREAVHLRTLVRLSRGLPEPAHDRLEASVEAYARRVLDHERDAMALGKEDPGAERAFSAIWQSLLPFEPTSARLAALHAEALARLSDASESRRQRLFQMGWSVPTAPWCVLLAIGVVIIALSCLFAIELVWLQAALTAAISGVIAAIFALLLWLDQPFSGGVRVDFKPFETLRATMGEAVGAAPGPPRK